MYALWSLPFRPFASKGKSEAREYLIFFQCKCAQYWPDQGCWTYGNIRVSVEDVTVLVDYTVRKFCIQQVLSPAPFPDSHLGSVDHQENGNRLGHPSSYSG